MPAVPVVPALHAYRGKFRPASKADFKTYAQSLQWLTGLPHLKAQETLARIYGYANRHEVVAVLQRPGIPGPFEDELPGYPYVRGQATSGLETWTVRARRIANEVLVEEGIPLPAYRLNLVTTLGLFASPKEHQYCLRLAHEQVLAIENKCWDTRAIALFQTHEFPWYMDQVSLERLALAESEFIGEATASVPGRQVSDLLAFHAAHFICEGGVVCAEQHPLRQAVFRYLERVFEDAGMSIPVTGEDSLFDVSASFIGFLAIQTGLNIDAFDSAWRDYQKRMPTRTLIHRGLDVFGQFLLTRDLSLVTGIPALEQISQPDVLARIFLSQWQQVAARCFLQNNRELYRILVGQASLPENYPEAESLHHLEVWVEVTPSLRTATLSFMTLWDYRATVGTVNTRTRVFSPVAAARGELIMPFASSPAEGGLCGPEPETFLADMAEHSDTLLRVHTLLTQRFFPSVGAETVEDYGDIFPRHGFMTLELELLPELRGSGVTGDIIRLLTATLSHHESTGWNAGYLDQFSRLTSPLITDDRLLGKIAAIFCPVPRPNIGQKWRDNQALMAHLESLSDSVGLPIIAFDAELVI